jgi:hypothetical protein
MLVRRIEYRGRLIQMTVLAQQGRWGYRIEDGATRVSHEIREPMQEDRLFTEAETAAKSEVDRLDSRHGQVAAAR